MKLSTIILTLSLIFISPFLHAQPGGGGDPDPGPPTDDVEWTGLVNLTLNADNSLTKTGAASWNARGYSLNIIKSGEDGFITFNYQPGSDYMVSLSKFNVQADYTILDHVLQIYPTNTYRIRETTNVVGNYGPINTGDEFKIAREGNAIKYYLNSTLIRTSALSNNSATLRVHVNAFQGTIPNIKSDFDNVLILRPQILLPGITNDNGSIALQVEGAQLPVSYLWSSGETTASISNKPRGTYSVTVTDAYNRTVTKSYSLGYPVSWRRPVKVAVNADNSLIRTATSQAYDGGASSLNLMPANTDGFLEFVVSDPTATYFIGLAKVDIDQTYSNISFAWQIGYAGQVRMYEGTTLRGDAGTLMSGDVFRIEREGGNIKYYKNGILQRTVAAPPAQVYMVDVCIYHNFGPVPVITTSFDKIIRMSPTIVNPDNTNANGSVSVALSGTYEPSNIQWSDGTTGPDIFNKPRGAYTATVTDALAGHAISRTYNLGYKVIWNNIRNMSVESDNTISKLTSSNAWDAGAMSANQLPANTDGWVEFAANRLGQQRFAIGLSRAHSDPGLTTMDYAIYFDGADGNVLIYESGQNRGTFAHFIEGDVYRIARENGFIKYYRNEVVLRSVAADPSFILYGDVAIYYVGAPMVTASFTKTHQTFYAIAHGNWNNGAVWSLTDGGVAASMIPSVFDIVNVKGFLIKVSTGVACAELNIDVLNENAGVKIDGTGAELKVNNQVNIRGVNNGLVAKALQVQNNGKISVLNQ